MSVYEARYRKIESEERKTQSSLVAAVTMSKFEVRRSLTGVWPKVPLIIGGFILFGFFILMDDTFLAKPAEGFWRSNEPLEFSVQGNASALLAPIDGPGSLIIIQIAVVSSGLIAGDLRDRAIELYFSKIRLREYFISKFSASFVLTFIGMPLFTIIYYIIAFYKRWPGLVEYSLAGEVLLRIVAFMIIEIILLSSMILAFSALTRNPVNGGILFIVFILGSRVFFETILYRATNLDIFYTLSPTNSLNIIRRNITGPEEILFDVTLSDNLLYLSILSYLIYLILSLLITYYVLYRETRK
ncbi:MAG: hypothetical protein ACXAD7_22435 [Candidatus Kariarchaeaceae archaeon]|jgi:hypothetical protein